MAIVARISALLGAGAVGWGIVLLLAIRGMLGMRLLIVSGCRLIVALLRRLPILVLCRIVPWLTSISTILVIAMWRCPILIVLMATVLVRHDE